LAINEGTKALANLTANKPARSVKLTLLPFSRIKKSSSFTKGSNVSEQNQENLAGSGIITVAAPLAELKNFAAGFLVPGTCGRFG
jgi:hypothetical protein